MKTGSKLLSWLKRRTEKPTELTLVIQNRDPILLRPGMDISVTQPVKIVVGDGQVAEFSVTTPMRVEGVW